jgi:ATP/ADP translocase
VSEKPRQITVWKQLRKVNNEMKPMLGKLFSIHSSEWQGVLYFFFVVLAFSFGSSIARSIALTLLVEHLGSETLPQAFILIDSAAFLGFIAYSHYTRHHSESGILGVMLLLGIGFSLVAQFLFLLPYAWVFGFFFVGFFLVYVFISIHLGSVVGAYFTAVQVKRLTGFINAGLPIGGALGGLVLMLLLQFLPPQALVIFLALAYGAAYLLLRRLGHVLAPVRSARDVTQRQRPLLQELRGTLAYLLHSPLLIYMGIGLLLFVGSTKLLEYQYQGLIYPQEFPDATARAQFFATYDVFANLAWLLLQLFVTSRIIVKLGVGASNLLHPLLVALVSALLLFNFSLVPGIVAQFVSQEMRQALRTPAHNLLFNAIPPNLWGSTKAFINGVMFPLGTLLSSFVIILLEAQMDRVSLAQTLPVLSFALAILGIGLAIPQWFAYNKGVFGLLNRTLFANSEDKNLRQGKNLHAVLKDKLRCGDARDVIVALGMVRILNLKHFVHPVGKLLRQSDNLDIKQECIDTLAALPHSEATATYLLNALKYERNPHTLALILANMRHFSLHLAEIMPCVEQFLRHPDPEVFSHCLLYLYNTPHYRAKAELEQRLLRRLEHPHLPRFAVYIYAVGELRQGAHSVRLEPLLNSPDAEVRINAFKAYIKLLGDKLDRARPRFVSALDSPSKDIKIAALQALRQCAPPPDWLPVIRLLAEKDRAVRQESLELLRLRLPECRPALLKEVFKPDIPVLEKFEILVLVYPRFTPEQRARLRTDGEQALRRYLSLRALQTLYLSHEPPSSLADLVHKILDEIAQTYLLQAVTAITFLAEESREFFQRVSRGLESPNRANQGNALEVLSNITEKHLGHKILRYFEARPARIEEFAQIHQALFDAPLEVSPDNYPSHLAALPHPLLRACLEYAANQRASMAS